jgi:hypothetical protein
VAATFFAAAASTLLILVGDWIMGTLVKLP